MKKLILTTIFLAGAMLTTSVASAQQVQGAQRVRKYGTLTVINQQLTGPITVNIKEGDVKGMDLVTFLVEHLNHATSATMVMTCKNVDTVGTPPRQITTDVDVCDVSGSGVCVSTLAQWEKPLTTPAVWAWRVDVSGFSGLSCTFTLPGGTAGDTLTVSAIGSTY